MKKFVKICLHSSFTMQNTFHLNEFFSFQDNRIFVVQKKFVKLCLHSDFTMQTPFDFDEIF